MHSWFVWSIQWSVTLSWFLPHPTHFAGHGGGSHLPFFESSELPVPCLYISVSFIWSRVYPSLICTNMSILLFLYYSSLHRLKLLLFSVIPLALTSYSKIFSCFSNILLWNVTYVSVYKTYIDRVQDMLPQNMVPWHTEYFKLKEFEKTGAGRTLWPSPEAGPKTFMWEVPSLCTEERIIFISRREDTPPKRNLNEQALLSFPQFTTLSLYSLYPITFLPDFPLFTKPSTKTHSFNYFFRSSFPSIK